MSYHAVTNSPCQYFPPLPTCCRCVCDLTGLVRESRLWPDSACQRAGGGSVLSVVPWHRVPPSDLVHVAHHPFGPCHFIAISEIWLVRVRGLARPWECERSAPSAVGTSGCGQASKSMATSSWAPVPLSPLLHGESGT